MGVGWGSSVPGGIALLALHGSAGSGLHLQCPHLIAEGKLKAVAERASVAGVIAALAACPGRGPSVAPVAGQAVEFVCKYYKARNL